MATFKKTLSGDDRYSIKLIVNETSTDISTNTSVVSYSLQATKSSGSGYYSYNEVNPIKITFDGNIVLNQKVSYDFTGSTPKTITLASGTATIVHDSDGSKTLQCSGYFKDADNNLGNATASGSLQLTQLHKAPEPYITNITENVSYLTSNNIANDVFVNNVSSKTFTLNAITYDDATINIYLVKNGTTSATGNNTITLNFANKEIETTNDSVPIRVDAVDNKNGVGITTHNYDKATKFIPYTKPTIVQSSITTKRDGQLTGKVRLVCNGTCYNGSVGNISITPTIYYSYVIDGTTYSGTLTPTPLNGNWSVDAEIGTNFNPNNSYDVQVYCMDQITTNVSGMTTQYYTSKVLLGKATWTEYSTYVDFKRITRKKGDIYGETELYYSASGTNGNVSLTKNGNAESSANYQYIEVFYYVDANNCYLSQKVYLPNGKKIQLRGENDNGTNDYTYLATYTFNGSTLTRNSEIRWLIKEDSLPTRSTTTTQIKIYRVVGYK